MVDSASHADLNFITEQLRDSPEFLAGWLAATPDADQLLARLDLPATARNRLGLCRAPRPHRFAADVTAIADYLDVTPIALAAVLREAAALAAFTTHSVSAEPTRDTNQAVGLLAAAHDTTVEQLPRSGATARLRRLAESTWDAAPPVARDTLDVEAAVCWSSAVAVVTLPKLALASANRWLDAHRIPRLDTGTDEPLQGLLIAWRGHGIIFVDGTLSMPERRFAVAHEQGHFLLDYAKPRHRLRIDAPDLLAVFDGQRLPTTADRARAALARVPLGLHTHLLERDAEGGAAQSVVAAEDDASLYALELLAPWEALLRLVRTLLPGQGSYAQMLQLTTDVVAEQFGLPAEPATSRAVAGLAALGVRRSFFDR